MDNAVLRITDGTEYVDLVGINSVFQVKDWKPIMANPKGGGVWSDQPFLHGRQLVHRVYENVIDNFTLVVRSGDMDLTIAATRTLRQLLQKASDYWTVEWATEPVWLEARGSDETNLRYTIIKDWRAPGDNNPFGTPFFACPSVMDEFSLLIEHDFWMGLSPGTGECVEISALSRGNSPYYLEFDGVDDNVNCGSAAALDDLTAGANGFTAEAWVRFDSDLGNEVIMGKGYWYLKAATSGGLVYIYGYIVAGTPAQSQGLWFTRPDDEWHHVAMTYNDGGTRLIRLWLDGVEAPSYLQTAAVGGLTSDAASSFKIGANAPADALWKSGIGWVRLSNTVLYTTTFTPFPRCVLPIPITAPIAVTVGLWICEGTGLTAYNRCGTAGTDGTITGAVWGNDCEPFLGREGICAVVGDNDTAFVSNQRGAGLSHVFYYSSAFGTYSVNLLGATLPYALYRNPVAVLDMLYFGSDTTMLDGGPFNNVVLDYSQVAQITGTAWEYWDGAAWVDFATTSPPLGGLASSRGNLLFGLGGVDIIYFDPPRAVPGLGTGAWTIATVNGITGYFIRCQITNINAAAAPPYQYRRNVYSCNTPFIEGDDSAVGGDVSALTAAYLYERTDDTALRALLAVRSTQRGSNFTAYINLADRGNPNRVTISAGGSAAFASDPRAPAGRYILYNPAPGPATWASLVSIHFTYPLTLEYSGRFRLILRAFQTGGASDDFYFRTYILVGIASSGYGKTKTANITGGDFLTPGLIDMGEIVLNVNELGYETFNVGIQVQNNAAAPGDLSLLDAWLIPIDESLVEAIGPLGANTSTVYHLAVDSLKTKRQPAKFYIARSTGVIANDWKTIAATALQIPQGTDFKVWSFLSYYGAGPIVYFSYQTHVNAGFLQKNERYFTMRGDT